MSTLKYIYIAADDDYLAVEMWHALRGDGFIPYCPNVVKLLGLYSPIDDPWEVNQAWFDKCDALFQIGSRGVEYEYAFARGIPVFTDINELQGNGRLRLAVL